ncbi:hypothetical protein NKH02_30465 [Mesorhizobium sp. M1396]
MKPITVTESEQPEIYAPVMREMPAIHRAVSKMAKQMRGLTDISQKQAIAELTAVWILAIYPENLDLALSLSDAMRNQVDIHLRESKKAGARHSWSSHVRPLHEIPDLVGNPSALSAKSAGGDRVQRRPSLQCRPD